MSREMRSSAALTARIRQVVDANGGPTAAAKLIGMSLPTLRSWYTGKVSPGAVALNDFGVATGSSVAWLLNGGPVSTWPEAGDPYPELHDDWELVPVYDIRAAAGAGAAIDEEAVIDHLAFRDSWLRKHIAADTGGLALLYVDGDSQEPILRAGDLIMINRKERAIREGLFVVRLGDGLLVKRLHRAGADQVVLKSENPAYDPVNVDLRRDGDGFKVIGRVVWMSRAV